MSADLLLPWPVVAVPVGVAAGATRRKLEIQTQLNVVIRGIQGIPRAFFRTVRDLIQNEARPVGHFLSCQNAGQRFVQRVHHVQGLLTSLVLYSLFCWSI